MCQAMDELRADWRAEGKAEALLASIRNIMKSMEFTATQAMDALLVPEDEREKYMSKL